MKTIDVLDEKMDLSALTAAVEESGEPIRLTRGGRPVADVVPHHVSPMMDQKTKEALFDEVDAFRKTLPKTSLAEILADINAGRR